MGVEQRASIDGIGHRAPDVHIVERRDGKVHADVPNAVPSVDLDPTPVGISLVRSHLIGWWRLGGVDVRAARVDGGCCLGHVEGEIDHDSVR
jgi:hypothetical protein